MHVVKPASCPFVRLSNCGVKTWALCFCLAHDKGHWLAMRPDEVLGHRSIFFFFLLDFIKQRTGNLF